MTVRPSVPTSPLGQLWKSLIETTSRGVDHDEVLAHVYDEGKTSTRYVIMTGLAAAIAMLALLMPSQAVLIGAMLLSPLMGPIILLGFSFWMVDWRSTKRALIGIAAGFMIALLLAILITWISPLQEPTTEILARARPTLFDLLVAIFSGLAGGYAVIKRKGETAIGVALAISLLPPITTIGFGIGIGAWTIALSAALLFVTNLVATLATHDTREAIAKIFGDKARIASLAVQADHGLLKVDALVATPEVAPAANDQLKTYLSRLTPEVAISLDQLVTGDPARFLRTATAPAPAAAANTAEAATRGLRDLVPFPTRLLMADGSGGGVVVLRSDSQLDLAGARALERGVRERAAYRNVIVAPPVQALPVSPLSFDEKGAPVFDPAFQLAVWALERWQPASLNVSGCRLGGAQASAVESAITQALPTVRIDFNASNAACPDGGRQSGVSFRLG